MITLIDNYDSFTLNIYHYLKSLDQNIMIYKNDEIKRNLKNISKSKCIIISPGPSHPLNTGECMLLMERFSRFIPILGICLGHQLIGLYFGAKIKQLKSPKHGKVSNIKIVKKDSLFNLKSNTFQATRYHSLYVDDNKFPRELTITSKSMDDDICMSLKHKCLNIFGVQFHPESIETKVGLKIFENFIRITDGYDRYSKS